MGPRSPSHRQSAWVAAIQGIASAHTSHRAHAIAGASGSAIVEKAAMVRVAAVYSVAVIHWGGCLSP